MDTDISNEIPLCESWDPSTLHSPIQPVPSPFVYKEDESEPIGQARQLAVSIPTASLGRADCFIDDIVNVMLDRPDNVARQAAATPLTVFACTRPHAGPSEPVHRREDLSLSKLEAEGTPAEVQIVLGWILDAIALLLLLPFDKYLAWEQDLSDIIRTWTVTLKQLESLIGRLNHAAYVVPLSRHFLTRLRRCLDTGGGPNQTFHLDREELEDAKLWLTFLAKARNGISLNNLTLREPSQLAISDSCPFGMGGFIWSGRAWRLQIPKSSILYSDDTANKLAMVVTIWLAIKDCDDRGLRHEHILGLGDNTSASKFHREETRNYCYGIESYLSLTTLPGGQQRSFGFTLFPRDR